MRVRAVLFAVALAACASSGSVTEPVVYSQAEAADSVKIRVGQTIIVGGIRVRFVAVENDSRCPSDVVCVWAGDATAGFMVELNCNGCLAPAMLLSLHTTLEPRSGEAHGYRIELRSLGPVPRSTSPIQPFAYWAWIRVTPRS